MQKRILAILLALMMLLSTIGALGEAAPAKDSSQLTREDLLALNGGSVTIHESEGKVTFVGGTCTDQPVKTAEDAEAVIHAMETLIGADEHTRFEPWRVLNDTAGNIYYVYQQVLDDILVQGGAAKVITDKDGVMLGFTASVVPGPEDAEKNNTPDITAQQAEELVLAHEKEAGNGEPLLVSGMTRKTVLPESRTFDVNADDYRSRYVWSVYTTNPSASVAAADLPYLAHYVTMNGEYLYSLPTIIPGDIAGAAGYDANYVFEFMEPAEYTGYVDFSDGTEHEISITLMRDTRTGMYYLGNIEHKIVVADCWEFLYNEGHVVLEYSPDNLEWDQTSLLSLYQYCQARDFYKAIGWNGPDGEDTPIIILKGFCDQDHNPVNNAAYAGKFYGWQTFLSSSINNFAQCLDVIAHEFTHGVTGTVMTYNAYRNDFGAINEAMSDIMGNLCEMMAGATKDTTWLIAENSGSAIRSMSDPNLYNQPDRVWDIYYQVQVKEPTDTNDHGGVHGNSSLLNHIAYLLCTDGGMSLEEARSFWFAVDCAMVPGSDYPQLKALLPWVLKISGLDSYQNVLNAAIDATRLGETGIPDPIDADRALLVLQLPDTGIYDNGKWLLQIYNFDLGKMFETIKTIIEDFKTGNLDSYPEMLRMFGQKPEPTPTPTSNETKPDFMQLLIQAMIEAAEEKPKQESQVSQEEKDRQQAMTQEMSVWIRKTLSTFFINDMGGAGQDGLSIRMMTKPGRVIPVLVYISVSPGGAKIDQLKTACFLNGRWVDIDLLLSSLTGDPESQDFEKTITALMNNEIVKEILQVLQSGEGLDGFLNLLSLNVEGGTTFIIPATGLDTINLEGGVKDQTLTQDAKPNDRKSRPKLAEETAPAGE